MGRNSTRWLFALVFAHCASWAYAQDLPPLLEGPARLVPTRSLDIDDTPPERRIEEKPRGIRLGRAKDANIVPARTIENRSERDDSPRRNNRDASDIDDFLERRTPVRDRDYKRSTEKFGDRFIDLFSADRRKEWLFSDHAFDNFASPISNPFLFEDPRSLTEVRPLFIYQQIPGPQPLFQGGNLWFLGGRASIAFTERFSVTFNKIGALSVNPAGSSLLDSKFGFSELWLGPKYAFYRDPQFGAILTGGAIFQIPLGSSDVTQNTGKLSIVPYLSGGKTLTEFRNFGTLNGIATTGYSFSIDKARSDYFYLSGHLDFDIFNRHRFYPVAEFNYFQYTTNGNSTNRTGEGLDLINFGGQSKGASLVTGALGGRFKITEAAQIGAAFELPLFGNKDLFRYRFTVDMILRY